MSAKAIPTPARARSGRAGGVVIAFAGCVFCSLLAACPTDYEGLVLKDPRIVRVDVRNQLFSPYANDVPVERGLWATRVSVTVATDIGTYDGSASAKADGPFGYTPIAVSGVTGELASVSVRVETAEAKSFSVELSDWEQGGGYQGWTDFRNVVKFRLDAKTVSGGVDGSTLVLEPCPRGGRSVRLFTDVGVTAAGSAVTDRGRAGQASAPGQVCVEPRWLEHPSGLALYLYYAEVAEDLPERYGLGSASSSAGYYMSDYWTNDWTATEIMSSGRSVAGKPIRLIPLRQGLDAANPEADAVPAYAAIRLDLSAYVGKYLVLAAVLRQGELYAPSEVICIKVK